MQGWVKLHRELIEKAIWTESTPEQKTILITLLMMANHKEKEWEFKNERYKAKPGQFVTSLKSITEKSGKGISIQNVRTALDRFKKYDFLTYESTNKNRLVTIVNWELYQTKKEKLTSESTSSQQATNKQLTTNKNVKNVKNVKETIPYGEIINYLNDKADRNFSSKSRGNQSVIKARWSEDYNLDDFKKVIDVCSHNWKGQTFSNGVKGDEYLRPSTLFNNKFDERLNMNKKDDQSILPTNQPRALDLDNLYEN